MATTGAVGSGATGREAGSAGERSARGSELDCASAARRRGGRAARGRLDRAGAALVSGSVSGDSAVEADRVGSSVMCDFS